MQEWVAAAKNEPMMFEAPNFLGGPRPGLPQKVQYWLGGKMGRRGPPGCSTPSSPPPPQLTTFSGPFGLAPTKSGSDAGAPPIFPTIMAMPAMQEWVAAAKKAPMLQGVEIP